MQARSLPLSYGYLWIQEGWRLFRSQPLALLFWSLATHILIQLGFFLPMLGQAILLLLTPSLTFIALSACQRIDQGHVMRLPDWLEPVKVDHTRKNLLKLGFLYAACSLFIAFISIFPFLNLLVQAVDDSGQIQVEALFAAMQKPLILFWVLYSLLSGLFWHAPALVGWHQIPIKKALFYSMVACWRNKWAFIVYGLFWFGLLFAAQQLSALLLNAGLGTEAAQFILTPVNMVVMAVLYASFYPAYKTIFIPAPTSSL